MEDFKGMRPVCPHSAYCGGCIYQGVPYEQQLAEKEREVHRLLEESCAYRRDCGLSDALRLS